MVKSCHIDPSTKESLAFSLVDRIGGFFIKQHILGKSFEIFLAL
jgi:hypothetical protein